MNAQITFFIGLFDELLNTIKVFRPVYHRTYITLSKEKTEAEILFKNGKLEVHIMRPILYSTDSKGIAQPLPRWHTKTYSFAIADPSFTITNLIDILYRGMVGEEDTLWSERHLIHVKYR